MSLIGRIAPHGLMKTAVRRGLIGGNPWWRGVGMTLLVGRALRRAIRREPELIASERLRPGAGLSIRTGRRARR